MNQRSRRDEVADARDVGEAIAQHGAGIRVGCDVIDLAEVAESLAKWGDRYLRRIFSEDEVALCRGDVARLAARFAAKEAAIKAFRRPDLPFGFHDITVASGDGLPVLQLSGAAAELARKQRWMSTSLSLSHSHCHAMAVVAVVTRAESA